MLNGGLVLQLALDTLATAGIYAMVGIGIYIAHSGTRVLHLAIGEVAMAGALVAAGLATAWPLVVAVPAGLAVAAGLSASAERLLVAPLARRVELAAILLIAAAVVLREVLRGLYSRGAYPFPSVAGTLSPGGGVLRVSDVVTVAAALAVAAGGNFVLRRTSWGAALRATAASPGAAAMIGVDTATVRTAAFAAGGALAAAAALLAADRLPLAATAGVPLALRGIAAAVAGRLRSPWTVCLGALAIGAVEVVSTYFLGAGGQVVADAVALLLLLTGFRR
ncbi:MAG: ABC transporter permease subunit [Candidatus Dormibacteria bacterium]